MNWKRFDLDYAKRNRNVPPSTPTELDMNHIYDEAAVLTVTIISKSSCRWGIRSSPLHVFHVLRSRPSQCLSGVFLWKPGLLGHLCRQNPELEMNFTAASCFHFSNRHSPRLLLSLHSFCCFLVCPTTFNSAIFSIYSSFRLCASHRLYRRWTSGRRFWLADGNFLSSPCFYLFIYFSFLPSPFDSRALASRMLLPCCGRVLSTLLAYHATCEMAWKYLIAQKTR